MYGWWVGEQAMGDDEKNDEEKGEALKTGRRGSR